MTTIEYFQFLAVKSALKAHVDSNGKMRLTRTATPTRVLQMASEYTGETYKRGQQAKALADMQALYDRWMAQTAKGRD